MTKPKVPCDINQKGKEKREIPLTRSICLDVSFPTSLFSLYVTSHVALGIVVADERLVNINR